MEGQYQVPPQPATPLRRRQISLEHIISFESHSPGPSPRHLADAELLYHEIVRGCRRDNVFILPHATTAPGPSVSGNDNGDGHYDRNELEHDNSDDDDDDYDDGRVYVHKLFHSLWLYCPTVQGKQNIIRNVLVALFAPHPVDPTSFTARSLANILPLAQPYLTYTHAQCVPINNTLMLLAHEILASLFLPLKAQGRCTPAVTSLITPTSRSEVGPQQGIRNRLHGLRALVLARDGGACVVSGTRDRSENRRGAGSRRARKRGGNMSGGGMKTEAAHIIPHCLNSVDDSGSLPASKHTVWRVLNMFDPGVSSQLEGALIDTPANAVLLLSELHDRFGALEAYFEELPECTDLMRVYRFVFADGYNDLPDSVRVKDRIEFVNLEPLGTPQSELPSRRLLALHRACSLILNMSGAAEYVECLLDDAEMLTQRGTLAADGTSSISVFLRMKGMCGDEEFMGIMGGEDLLVW
ncbi:hypothetical protein Q9L58_006238 [Maublancomyces gigas]|uniref:HNH nuclease domain-containing protein n=1 Tax=Discina gigas TaxID=1032678 RepID=A0ABR3GFU8_9PEZI